MCVMEMGFFMVWVVNIGVLVMIDVCGWIVV